MVSFGEMNGQTMMPVFIHWQDGKKNRMDFFSFRQIQILYSILSRTSWVQRKIQVTGYTTLKIYEKDCMQPVMYYAMEYVSGSKRYDYAMFQFNNDDGSFATVQPK
jgi:hypothetical protein